MGEGLRDVAQVFARRGAPRSVGAPPTAFRLHLCSRTTLGVGGGRTGGSANAGAEVMCIRAPLSRTTLVEVAGFEPI
jgi:hypothetical protein